MNLDEAQTAHKQEHNSSVIYSKQELVEQRILLCLQSARRVVGRFGPEWELTVVHKDGTQKLWFAARNKNGEPSYWDKVFSNVTEWPNHSYRLVGEKFLRFVAQSDPHCPCQDREVDAILAETLGDDAPASVEQLQALRTLATSLRVDWPMEAVVTVADWRRSMRELAMKQAGMA